MNNNYFEGPVYIQEEKDKFTANDLKSKLGLENEGELIKILNKLSLSNIVKIVEDEIKFSFVGVLIIENIIIYCYPKYMDSYNEGKFKQVLQVIKKVNKSEDVLGLKTNLILNDSPNILPLLLFFVDDYFIHGLYEATKNITELNSNGRILWKKTINTTFPFIKNNKPYYFELYNKKRVSDYNNYFRQLHEIIISECSAILKNNHFDKLFGIELTPNLTDQTLDNFDDLNHITHMISKERNIQFNTHKLDLLEKMEMYLDNENSFGSLNNLNYFGTTNFNIVWEKICCEVFDDMLHTPLNQLPITIENDFLDNYKNLYSIIEKPTWRINNNNIIVENTFLPDLITIYNKNFLILDAKYYTIDFGKKGDKYWISGQPGIESIAKQYLYEVVFSKFTKIHNLKVLNSFLFPVDENKNIKGFAELGILHNLNLDSIVLNLENIQVVLIPAERLFDCYLNSSDKYNKGWKYKIITNMISSQML